MSTVSASDVARTFRHYLNEKQQFCARLELVADLLPDRVDSQDCLLVAQNVVPLVKRAHDFEEGTVFPLLLARNNADAALLDTLERLRFEHIGDEDFAVELCVSLRQFALQPTSVDCESLAWMLRGFFEGLRRHIAFEREHLLPLVEQDQHPIR